MAYTSKQLTMAWTAVHSGIAPDAATQKSLDAFANLSLSDAQVMSYVLNSGDDTTAVAVLTYQFFTGKAPTKAGMDYLLNSATNPNDLNDAYYAKFNAENRYINFAANLGVNGEDAADFAAKYGAMSFGDYVASIYETIIGGTYAKAAGIDVAAAVAFLVGTRENVLATARASGMVTDGMTPAQVDLALKAAMAGLVMAASVKSDIGIYAASANNFMLAMAQDKATYGADLVHDYGPTSGKGSDGTGKALDTAPAGDAMPGAPPPPPPPPPPEPPPPPPVAFTLTAGVDRFIGGSTATTFTATDATFTAGDILDGRGGQDTLTLTLGAGGRFNAPNAAVANIETATVTGARPINLDTTGWTGLTHLTVAATGENGVSTESRVMAAGTTDVDFTVTNAFANDIHLDGGHNVTLTITGAANDAFSTPSFYVGDVYGNAHPTGTVTIDLDSAGTGVQAEAIVVRGGTEITVNQTASNPLSTTHTNALVTIYGDAITTKVTATAPKADTDPSHAGVVTNGVYVNDFAFQTTGKGSITTVSVDGFDGFGYSGNALTTLYAAHGDGNIDIQNAATPDSATTLDLTLDGYQFTHNGFVADRGAYTTLNLVTEDEASHMAMLAFQAATTVNISGQSQLRIDNTSSSTHLETINILSGGLVTDVANNQTLTLVDASTASADNDVTLKASQTAYKGGAGVDHVTLTDAAGTVQPIDGGDGTDTLAMDATAADTAHASGNGGFGSLVQNFEHLVLTGAAGQAIQLATLGDYHHVTTHGGNGMLLMGLESGDTLALDGAGTSYTLGASEFGGADDHLALSLTAQAAGPSSTTYGAISAGSVETLDIDMRDAGATSNYGSRLTWMGNDLKAITVSGQGNLALTADSSALTSIDASALTGRITWGSNVAQSDTITIHGGSGNNYIGADHLTEGLNFIGGAGANSVAVGGGHNVIDFTASPSASDVVIFISPDADSASTFTEIEGLGQQDAVVFAPVTLFSGVLTKIDLGAASFDAYLDQAASGTTAGTMSWFELNGHVYVVADKSTATTFTEGTDLVVQLTGMAGDFSSLSASSGTIYF